MFATGDDPVKVGLVARLNRPGGNITGISFFTGPDLESKQLELLREVVPKAGVIGVLVNPTAAAAESQERDARVAARALGLQILTLNASSERDIDAAFAAFAHQGAGALLIAGSPLFTGRHETASKHAPCFVVPADNKWFTRLVVAAAIVDAMETLNLAYPKVDAAKKKQLAAARVALSRER